MPLRAPFAGLYPNFSDHIGCPAHTIAHQEGDAVFLQQHEFGHIGLEGIADQTTSLVENVLQII
ncbi:hypothetical protein D3C75_1350680 [compost metagenome]